MTPLKSLLFNARSIRNKFTELKAMVAAEQYDVIGITETWLQCQIRDYSTEYHLRGYKMFYKDRSAGKGGGVAIYIKEDLYPVECNNFSEYELIGVKLNLQPCLYIFLTYRKPQQTLDVDIKFYDNLTEAIGNKLSLIMGDFNCGGIDWSTKTSDSVGERLLNFIDENFLTQWVHEPTRGKNVLDIVLSSDDELISNLEVADSFGGSDHNTIVFNINIPQKTREVRLHRLDYKKADFRGLKNSLSNYSLVDGDLNDIWNDFKSNLLRNQSKFIPSRKDNMVRLDHPKWLTKELVKLIRDKDKAYKQVKLNCSNSNREKFFWV